MSKSKESAPIMLLEENIRIPGGIGDLESFRRWTHGRDFPTRGRIDWVGGAFEIDMSPEDINRHGVPKSAIGARLVDWIHDGRKGTVFIDRTRIASVPGDFSAEPDIVVVLDDSVRDGRVTLVPAASGKPGRYIEIEGPPDLIVEIVSDSSTRKDRRDLKSAYERAGVSEYWLVDARRTVTIEILLLGRDGFEPSPTDAEGWTRSRILGRSVRLERSEGVGGFERYRLLASD